jgi:FMN phosphatase YigB (HAD superfamily)
MTIRALITDLDNTLYDWVTFFAISFDAMVTELTRILEVDRHTLLSQFKEINQRYASTETPWAALELPAARLRFPYASQTELAEHLDSAFHAFSAARKKHLKLYDGVKETLETFVNNGVILIAHTEALPVNAFYRLSLLGVADWFSRLYTIEGTIGEHPFPGKPRTSPAPNLIKSLPQSERKPNPAVLVDICRREGFSTDECLYIGDSLIRDVAMAKQAGVRALWARYGTKYDPELWNLLVSVTHWSSADVEREANLREKFRSVEPDFVIDRFNELLGLCELPTAARGVPY